MIKLAKPCISKESKELVLEILNSGNLVRGKYTKILEEEICKYLSINHAIAVSSCTAALHLALLSLDIKEGDEIIVPAFTFPATVNVIERMNARPVFIDINLDDFCINTSKIEKKITEKTKGIIVVHEFGQAANMSKLKELAQKYKLFIIEDAACALGTEYKGEKAGTLGHIGCFSFHPRKTITTGEGGVVVTNNADLAKKIRALQNHGIDITKGCAEFKYAGLNYRITDFQAALGIDQLKKLDDSIKKKRLIVQTYNKNFQNTTLIKTPKNIQERYHSYQTYHLLLNKTIDRNKLINELKSKGIETNLGAQAVPFLKYYKEKYNLKEEDYENSIFAYNQGLALPLHLFLKEEEILFIIKNIQELIK